MSSWSSRKVRSPWRTTAWSSAIRTRISVTGHLQANRGPLARRRGDPKPGSERTGALLHRREAEAPGPQAGLVRVKPHAVVRDGEPQPVRALVELDLDAARTRVP